MSKLVTAILPTRSRQKWAAQAVDCFLAQTYESKNMVIIDDADDPSFPDDVDHPQILRIVLPDRKTIAAKQNIGIDAADGELIMNWNSDDWYAPERMADQVARLEWSEKNVTGYSCMLFHHPESNRWAHYVGWVYAHLGTSLCYRRSWALEHRYVDNFIINEDGEFVRQAVANNEYYSVPGTGMIVARAHDDNTSIKTFDVPEYKPVNPSMIPAGYPG